MLFFEVLIVGGVAYAGARAFSRRQVDKNIWLQETQAATPARLSAREQNLGQQFMVTSVSLGLTVTGAVLASNSLSLASIPLNLYTTIPLLEDSFQQLLDRRQLKFGLFISTITLGAMVARYYFVASLVDWSYHFVALLNQMTTQFNQRLLGELEHYYHQALYQFLNTKPASVWVKFNEVEVNIPFAELNIGDILILEEYNVVPIDGLIVEGTAKVDRYILTGEHSPVEVQPGDMILTSTIILSGRLCIEVSRK